MTQISRRIGVTVVAVGLLLGVARPAQAALILTMEEVAGDVVLSGGGTADLTGLVSGPGLGEAVLAPFFGLALLGADPLVQKSVDSYPLLNGPAGFGPSLLSTLPTSGSGDRFGIAGTASRLAVPANYASGDPLSATNMYAGATFASLGVTPGTYVWTWGSGRTTDSLTLRIGPAAVPEPVSLFLLAVGVAGLGVRRWRRRTA